MSGARLDHQPVKTPSPAALRNAACKNVEDPEIFMGTTAQTRAEAAAICAACPVRQACLDYAHWLRANSHGAIGVWGGYVFPEKGVRWQIGPPVDLPEGVNHATRRAWRLHGCRCEPCGDAESKAVRTKEIEAVAVA